MRLARLWLSDFRCHTEVDLEVASGVTVLAGANAAGKTSLLEALGWLARMKSFRGAPDSALVRVGAERAVIRAEVERPSSSRPALIEAEVTPSGRNRVRVNTKPLPRARDLLGALRVTVFTPDDLGLVKGGPAGRRAELDDLLVALSPRYDAVRADYERILRHRNAWLKSWSRADDPATLDIWDDQLVRAGAELVRARLKLVDRLSAPLGKAYMEVAGPGSSADVGGWYEAAWCEGQLGIGDLDAIPENLAAAVAGSRRVDLERRLSGVGPHRDDWCLTIGGLDARRFASQGEQRSLALAIRLAGHGVVADVVGDTPVLLLDDVFSELDEARATGLVTHLRAGQALVTTAGWLPPGLEPERVIRVGGDAALERRL